MNNLGGRAFALERRTPKMPNQIALELESKILDMTRNFPSYSCKRIADELQLTGISVSGTGVRNLWIRHKLEKKLQRFLWLEQEAGHGRAVITDKMLKYINKAKKLNEATDQHIEVTHPGELISQDLYFIGYIKGVGKVYTQAAVDCATSVGFAKVVPNKLPIHAVALLHEKVVPFFDQHQVLIQDILTDQGREYSGDPCRHPFEIYLGSMNIGHRKTRVASPYTNGFVERFHQTLKNEFFAKQFRAKTYSSIQDLQDDLDQFMDAYNNRRAHSGYRNKGRPPMKTFQSLLLENNQRPNEADL